MYRKPLCRSSTSVRLPPLPLSYIPSFFPASMLTMATVPAVTKFFSSPRFAVAGASSDKDKFGYKGASSSSSSSSSMSLTLSLPLFPYSPSNRLRITTVFMWYKLHDLPVTPINPTTARIDHPPTSCWSPTASPTVPSAAALPEPAQTALSVVTPPRVTLAVLRDAAAVGVPAVWLQPGSFDDEVLEFARANGRFETVIAGADGASAGEDGWCVLVDGEEGLRSVGKTVWPALARERDAHV